MSYCRLGSLIIFQNSEHPAVYFSMVRVTKLNSSVRS